MNVFNPFNSNTTTSQNNSTKPSILPNNLFGQSNNDNKTSNLNSGNFSFGANTNPNTTNSLFSNAQNNGQNTVNFGSTLTFGQNLSGNQNNNTIGTNNFGQNNNSNILFGQNNNNAGNNNNANNQNGNNIIFNNKNNIDLKGINNINNNQNNNNNGGNNNPANNNPIQNQQYLNLNDIKVQSGLTEYKNSLLNVEKCFNPGESENMFKDYIYMPTAGKSSSEVNIYRPYTIWKNQEKIINDYNIWEKGNANNKNPKEFFTAQISSVDGLVDRNKLLEKAILSSIGKTVEEEKNLEKLNKQLDDEMNNKILDLKNRYLKVEELEISLSSKLAQYNYLVGSANENVSDSQEIKDNIKKVNDKIKKNNMIELCNKIKKSSNENFSGENKNFVKDMSKERINNMLDGLVEIQNMMTVIYNNNKKNMGMILGMQKEAERIFKKNDF